MNNQTDSIVNDLNKKLYSDDLVEIILTYCYTNALPINKTINEKNLDTYFNFIKRYKELENLQLLIKAYLNNTTLKKRMKCLFSLVASLNFFYLLLLSFNRN